MLVTWKQAYCAVQIAINTVLLKASFNYVSAQTEVVLHMAGGHWNDTRIGRSAAQRCVDSIILYVLLHLWVRLVMGTSALALRSRSAILGDPLCWAEHSNPHQPAVLVCHWTGAVFVLLFHSEHARLSSLGVLWNCVVNVW